MEPPAVGPTEGATIMARFILYVVTSADGYIARGPGDPPSAWASAEEQASFFAAIAAADWAIMGRGTHEAAPRRGRRRIVFSSRGGGWCDEAELWCDPGPISPADLVAAVRDVRPLRTGAILGGTRVHDWFLAHHAIDAVRLSVEPVSFGAGLPLFSDSAGETADAALAARGFRRREARRLNAAGTRHELWRPAP